MKKSFETKAPCQLTEKELRKEEARLVALFEAGEAKSRDASRLSEIRDHIQQILQAKENL